MSTESAVRGSFETITDYLSSDHHRLDGLLAEVEREVARGSFERARELFVAFEAGLDRHIRLEEELLFPLFEARVGILSGPTVVLRMEHRQIRVAAGMMRDGLAVGEAARFRDGRRWLDDVLPQHDSKEEHILYPMTDRFLSARERAVFVARLTTF
jgi:hemerythrin-like domain-containing protein